MSYSIPQLISPDQAKDLHLQGILFLQRYRGKGALRPHQLNPQLHKVDPETHIVTGLEGDLIGVLAGNPGDAAVARLDLAQVTSIRGLLGQAVADLDEMREREEDLVKEVYSVCYVKYARQLRAKLIDGKDSDEGIKAWIIQDHDYQQARERAREAKRAYYSMANLHDDLENLENTLKKCIEYGAQT